MAFSLFDHPHFARLLEQAEVAAWFTPEAEVEAMLRVEVALAEAEAELGVIPNDAAAVIAEALSDAHLGADLLAEGVARDGLAVPILVQHLRALVGDQHGRHLHFGATSQDVIDSGLMLRLKDVLVILRRDLGLVIERLAQLDAEQGAAEIMGRTRMQRALPITFSDRLATWAGPLKRQLAALDAVEREVLVVQFGGPVGTLDKLGGQGPAVRAALAKRLGLADPGRSWHAERDRVANLASWLSVVAGSLGKVGQDLVLMAQNEVGEASLADGGRSSAMRHKRNPVRAELLVTLAHFNAGQLGLMHQALVHEGERSGIAWTLEWLVLPQMVAATTASLKVASACLQGLKIQEPG